MSMRQVRDEDNILTGKNQLSSIEELGQSKEAEKVKDGLPPMESPAAGLPIEHNSPKEDTDVFQSCVNSMRGSLRDTGF